MNLDELRNKLLNAENRIIQDGLEFWESWEMNYGPSDYCLWLTSFEYLQEHLGVEPIRMQPKSRQLLEFLREHNMELPWLRLVALPEVLTYEAHNPLPKRSEFRFPHMRVACRFEGRYKWTLFIDWMTKPYHPGIRGSYWLSASYREPELPDDPNELLDVGQPMEEKYIGGDFSIHADVEGWISLVQQIIDIERENFAR
jgi:hypothetical protein